MANRVVAPVSYDLFDVKQYQGETLKEYISRFGAQVVKVVTTDESMIVYAFRKGCALDLLVNRSIAAAAKLLLK